MSTLSAGFEGSQPSAGVSIFMSLWSSHLIDSMPINKYQPKSAADGGRHVSGTDCLGQLDRDANCCGLLCNCCLFCFLLGEDGRVGLAVELDFDLWLNGTTSQKKVSSSACWEGIKTSDQEPFESGGLTHESVRTTLWLKRIKDLDLDQDLDHCLSPWRETSQDW